MIGLKRTILDLKQLATPIIMAVLLVFSLAACSSNTDDILPVDEDHASSMDSDIVTMTDWTSAADHIIVATQAGGEEYENGSPKYALEVEQELKGTLPSNQINVYSLQGLPQDYKRFVLFLYSNDSEYYDTVTYNVIHSVNALEGDELKTGPYKGQSLKKLLKDIDSSPGLQKNSMNKHEVTEQYDSIEELIEASDYILHIVPKELRFQNNTIAEYTVDLVTLYKGDERIKAKESLVLPKEAEADKEYLIFYRLRDQMDQSDNPSITLTARQGSFIPKSDEKAWQGAIDLLQQP
ncbi:hypothetical protein ACX93W_12130 [Paenibacillus sp. CAU 1782]